jgi:hypothetical protein
MTCMLHYDLLKDGYQHWAFFVLGILLGAVGVALFVSGRGTPLILYIILRVGGIGFAVAWFSIGIYQTYLGYSSYRQLIGEYSSGQDMNVEGVVSNFISYEARRSSRPRESFTVDGRTFFYSPDEIGPGFQETRARGSPIENGIFVRIRYIGDVIVRLETCHLAAK